MKTSVFLGIMLGCIVLSFSSCSDDDGYSLGKQWISLATVEPLGEHSYYLTRDDGSTLGIVATNFPYYRPKEDQRVLVNYTLLSDSASGYTHLAKVNGIRNILTKNIFEMTSQNEDSIGHDPVKIHKLWIGDHYMNFYFGYNTSTPTTHYINLVYDTTQEPAADEKVHLEFRHNAKGDGSKYGVDGFAAFDLKPYWTEGKDSVQFVIDVKDFDGDKTYNITYRFNKSETFNLDESALENIKDGQYE